MAALPHVLNQQAPLQLRSASATASGRAMNGDVEAVHERGEQQPGGSAWAESASAAAVGHIAEYQRQEQSAVNDDPDSVPY